MADDVQVIQNDDGTYTLTDGSTTSSDIQIIQNDDGSYTLTNITPTTTSTSESSTTSGSTSNTSPLDEVISFAGVISDLLYKLKQLGYDFFGNPNPNNLRYETIQTTVKREFSGYFPPDMYSYDIPVKETKKVLYVRSSSIDALRAIGFNIGDEDVYEIEETINDYDIRPPVAILRQKAVKKTATMFLIPNTDVSYVQEHVYTPYIYIRPTDFSYNVFLHIMSFIALQTLTPTAMRVLHVIVNFPESGWYMLQKKAKTIGVPDGTLESIMEVYEKSSKVRAILRSIASSLDSMTGGATRMDVDSMMYILSSVSSSKKQKLIYFFSNRDAIILQVKKIVPYPRLVKGVLLESRITKYTSYGDVTLQSVIVSKMTSSGKYTQTTESQQISKGNVMTTVPLLRAKPIAIQGYFPQFKLAQITDIYGNTDTNEFTYAIGTTSEETRTLSISLPTTNVDLVREISNAYQQMTIKRTLMEGCVDDNNFVRYIDMIMKYPQASISWNRNNYKLRASIICKTLK